MSSDDELAKELIAKMVESNKKLDGLSYILRLNTAKNRSTNDVHKKIIDNELNAERLNEVFIDMGLDEEGRKEMQEYVSMTQSLNSRALAAEIEVSFNKSIQHEAQETRTKFGDDLTSFKESSDARFTLLEAKLAGNTKLLIGFLITVIGAAIAIVGAVVWG